MKNDDIKFMHIREDTKDDKNEKVMTVAYRRVDKLRASDVYFTIAFCSEKDQFCKATGRSIAEGRLNKFKYPHKITNLDTNLSYNDIERVIKGYIDGLCTQGFGVPHDFRNFKF